LSSDEEFRSEIKGYAFEEKLGRGRTGSIYRSRGGEGKPVAVRTFGNRLEPLGAKALERIEDVWKRLEQVVHSAIPRVIARGKHEDRPYVVTQQVTGDRLDRVLDEQRLPLEQVLLLGKTLADALSAAHQAGLVHTDICPRCIVVAKDPPYALLGWSAARPLRTPLGKDVPRASLRPPEGEAPEALALPALDVYGVGVILYEALAYAPPRPFDASAPPLLRHAWPPSRLNPTVRSDVEAVVLKAIDPDARARYATAAALAEDLAALMDGRPPHAASGRKLRSLARSVKRRPALFAALALGVAAGAGLAAASFANARARSRRVAADLDSARNALARGELDRAASDLARAREDDPSGEAVLEAVALVESARAGAASGAEEKARAARVEEAEGRARDALARARARRSTLAPLEEAVRGAAAAAQPLDPADGPEKRELDRAASALEAAAREEAAALGEAVSALRRALAFAPEEPRLRALLADVELERCLGLDSPRERDRVHRAFHEAVAATVEGAPRPARLLIAVEPSDAQASLRRAEASPEELAVGREVEVAAGEATVTLHARGFADAEVLVHLEPGRTTRVHVLLAAAAGAATRVLVPGLELELPPAPLALAGRDASRASSAVARVAARPIEVAPALVSKQLVTCAEYAEFVREKGAEPPVDRQGQPVLADALAKLAKLAVTGVSLEQALAYAKWRNARLPTRAELWAARARGARGELREWTDGPEGPLVLDLRVDREVVGDERVVGPTLRAADLGFRTAESAR
jgi:hypothetical protein